MHLSHRVNLCRIHLPEITRDLMTPCNLFVTIPLYQITGNFVQSMALFPVVRIDFLNHISAVVRSQLRLFRPSCPLRLSSPQIEEQPEGNQDRGDPAKDSADDGADRRRGVGVRCRILC